MGPCDQALGGRWEAAGRQPGSGRPACGEVAGAFEALKVS